MYLDPYIFVHSSFLPRNRVLKLFMHYFDAIRCSVYFPLFVYIFLFASSACVFIYEHYNCHCYCFSVLRCGFLMFLFWLNIWYIHFFRCCLAFCCLLLWNILWNTWCFVCFCSLSRVYSFYSVVCIKTIAITPFLLYISL